jgi:hypothetical protein
MINIYFLIISFKLCVKNFQEHRIHGFPIVLINYGHTLEECKLESVIVGVTMQGAFITLCLPTCGE